MTTTASDRTAAGTPDLPSRTALVIKWVRLVAAVIIVAVLVAFIVDNSEQVRVGFVFFHANVSLIWVLLITAALGALADRLIPRVRARRARSNRRR
ncbi:MAG: hypothetical protein J2O39_04125 [Acidimicrobiales bacterium]|nr:hypothetical protein [Acidimicrobiales bacterium]MBO0893543.1 hypothetical protein [Acidimicrobiales bacterium]